MIILAIIELIFCAIGAGIAEAALGWHFWPTFISLIFAGFIGTGLIGAAGGLGGGDE